MLLPRPSVPENRCTPIGVEVVSYEQRPHDIYSRRQLAIATPDRGIEPFHYWTQDRTETSHLRTRPRALPAEPTRSHSSSNTAIMSGAGPSPRFFQQPLRYMKWASINKPAYFYSIMVGCAGPALVVTVPPIRRYMGEEQIPKIPMTYPGMYDEQQELAMGDRFGSDGRKGEWRARFADK